MIIYTIWTMLIRIFGSGLMGDLPTVQIGVEACIEVLVMAAALKVLFSSKL